jgi:hypothetical protein
MLIARCNSAAAAGLRRHPRGGGGDGGAAVAHFVTGEHAQIWDFEPAGTTPVDETTLVEQHAALTASGRGPTR